MVLGGFQRGSFKGFPACLGDDTETLHRRFWGFLRVSGGLHRVRGGFSQILKDFWRNLWKRLCNASVTSLKSVENPRNAPHTPSDPI